MEKVLAFLIPIGLSVFCWWMVFDHSARRKSNEPGYDFLRLNKEARETWDGLSLATSLIGALFFSLVSIVFVVVAIYRWFAE